jgi:hypothetical protein
MSRRSGFGKLVSAQIHIIFCHANRAKIGRQTAGRPFDSDDPGEFLDRSDLA